MSFIAKCSPYLRGLIAAFVFVCAATPTAMAAVVLDPVVSTTTNVVSGVFSFSHTVGTGSDRYLLVGVSIKQGGGATATNMLWEPDVGADQPLARIGMQVNNNKRRVEIWGLAAPSSGTGTVSGAFSHLSPDIVLGAMSFSGVEQTAPASLNFFSNTDRDSNPTVTACPDPPAACSVEPEDYAISVVTTNGSHGPATVPVTGPITFDASSSSTDSNVSSLTWSHAIGPGTPGTSLRKLVVGVAVEDPNGTCTTIGNKDVTNVTYAGVPLTPIPSAVSCAESSGYEQRIEAWYLDEAGLNGISGTNPVVVTLAGTVDDVTGGAVSGDGLSQSGPEQTAINDALNTTTITTNIGSGSHDAWLIDIVGAGDAGTFTAGAGQTQAWTEAANSSAASMSYKLPVSGAANSMTQTLVGGGMRRLAHSVLRFARQLAAELYSVTEGTSNSDAFGAASAWRGTGGALNMGWSLPANRRWAIGAVLLKASATPTRAFIRQVGAYATNDGPVFEWRTTSERGTLGFHVRRFSKVTGGFQRVTQRLIPSMAHSGRGGTYRLRDEGVRAGETHHYKLIEREVDGSRRVYGPFEVTVARNAAGAGVSGLAPLNGDYERRPHAESKRAKLRKALKRKARKAARRAKLRRRGATAKVLVSETGVQYLGAETIANVFGWPTERVRRLIEDRRLRLSSAGSKVATLADVSGAGLYFYGEAGKSQYSAENVYWLKPGRGVAMRTLNGRNPPAVSGLTFAARAHAEVNNYPQLSVTRDPDSDYWFWDFLLVGPTEDECMSSGERPPCVTEDLPVPSPGLAPGPANLTVRLQGVSETSLAVDHRASVTINGKTLGTIDFDGAVPAEGNFDVDASWLVDSDNQLVTIAAAATGKEDEYSVFYINNFDLAYTRRYSAVDDRLAANSAQHDVVTIDSFKAPDVLVFDVTEPSAPLHVVNTNIEADASGYRASLAVPAQSMLYALTREAALTPHVVADKPSRLRDRRNRADWVLISTDDLLPSAKTLEIYRRQQGFETMLVNIENVYDEFNYGNESPEAIWRFVRYAKLEWHQPPSYFVLGGDGSFDYLGHAGSGKPLIPTMLAPTPKGLISSDNLYADVLGNDHVPEVSIGRLPVGTPDEMMAIGNKIIAYETSLETREGIATFVADAADEAGDFPTDSDVIAERIPANYGLEKIYVDEFKSVDDARNQLLDSLIAGRTYVNFVGHGDYMGIGSGRTKLLDVDDVANLDNGDGLPVFTALTCLAGDFSFLGGDSLAETLVTEPTGGAIAVWGASGLSNNADAIVLGDHFYEAVFEHGEIVLGDAIARAQSDYAHTKAPRYLLDAFNLLGDPATAIPSPAMALP